MADLICSYFSLKHYDIGCLPVLRAPQGSRKPPLEERSPSSSFSWKVFTKVEREVFSLNKSETYELS